MQTGHRPGPPPPAPRGDGPAPKESLRRARARARPQGTVLACRLSVLGGASRRISGRGLGSFGSFGVRGRAPGRRGPVLAPEVNRDPEGVRRGSRLGSGRRVSLFQRPKRGAWSTRSIPTSEPEPRLAPWWRRCDRRPTGWDRRRGLPCPGLTVAGAAPSGPAPRPEPKPEPPQTFAPFESGTFHPPDRRIYP